MPEVNKVNRGVQYGKYPYNTILYGQQELEEHAVNIKAHYAILGPFRRVIHAKYKIKARYTGNEATIEDIYSYATRRYMALGCLDGPLFPFYFKQNSTESIPG